MKRRATRSNPCDNSLETQPHYRAPSIVCCCRNGNQPLNGLIYTNCGCKIHGLHTAATHFALAHGGDDVQMPSSTVRGSGGFHRIASE